MIAVDSSSFIAYLSGDSGDDVEKVEFALEQEHAVLAPVVLSELLSDPKLPQSVVRLLKELPQLAVSGGYWERAGKLRSKLLAKRLKARLADALIAQSCLDHRIPLITRDTDFRHYARLGGLKIL